jgi:hypothetical protein
VSFDAFSRSTAVSPQESFVGLQRSARARGRRLSDPASDVVLSSHRPILLPMELSAQR